MTTQENDNEISTFEGTLKRAREGNALSQNLLGIWILNSQLPDGVEVNEDPYELIRLSAEQGFPTAQYNMGVILETGYLWMQKDEKQAFEWYRKAANQGCAAAMAAVGICLYNGVGTEPNLFDALSWLKEAATQGEQRGQLFLAEILAKDERCCDKNEALYWFCQLARHESLRNPELRGFVF